LSLSMETVRDNLELARELIDKAVGSSGEDGRHVRIMAVTKTHPPEVVKMALSAGVRLIGENRVSEGGRKIRAVGAEAAEFHMIGPIHTREVRQAVRDFHWIDSLDRMKIAGEIARRTVDRNNVQPGLLLEVNTSGEGSKHGFQPDAGQLEEVLGQIAELGLKVSGLLTIGPLDSSQSRIREAFALLRTLRDRLRERCCVPLEELSMGMSDDFELAVKEGATTVRLGRFLFGRRRRI